MHFLILGSAAFSKEYSRKRDIRCRNNAFLLEKRNSLIPKPQFHPHFNVPIHYSTASRANPNVQPVSKTLQNTRPVASASNAHAPPLCLPRAHTKSRYPLSRTGDPPSLLGGRRGIPGSFFSARRPVRATVSDVCRSGIPPLILRLNRPARFEGGRAIAPAENSGRPSAGR